MGRIALAFLTFACLGCYAQPSTSAGSKFGPQWQLLVGTWRSEASAGVGAGTCAFRFELGNCVLVRTNQAEIPAAANRPGGTHQDLMVIHPGKSETEAHASYWDNEGHIIEYSAAWSADGTVLTFLSKPGAGPQFRLTYKKLDADTLNVSFDMAAPGQGGAFKPYVSGRIRRQT